MPDPRPEPAVPQSDHRRADRRALGLGAAVALTLGTALTGTAAADSPETPAASPVSCSPVEVRNTYPAQTPLLDWSENVLLDPLSGVWVSRTYRDVVERHGDSQFPAASVPVTSPGAVRRAPDGLLYATFGNSPLAGAAKQGGVVRFDPRDPVPKPEVFVSGLGQANGAAFDADGDLFVADTSANTVERIHPDGTLDTDWTERARIALAALGSGADGIVADGGVLYVTLLESPTARVVALPIADPAQATVAVDLARAPLAAPLLPDDLVVGQDGFLYIATGSGQLVRADPVTHTSCTMAFGEPLTSVGTYRYGDHRMLLVLGTENGDLLSTTVLLP
ncbi:hypothetical protein GPX89_12400 [Nocardia sp. ET3-3]|uniref:SMP-30/Gluconolactonase/LRE-like region domain-containing protein n=1 Tax=Nocardia terrae TaxID=2675851 RepID=A0A7K1UUK9_9NOCA|nr:hypothetical protein [Nocardia terrae]MVU78043.1 hypothetical protein [Nocardia terrae]